MKKLFLFAAILFTATSMVKVQAADPIKAESKTEAKTELTVTLNPIQIITIKEVGVDLAYVTKENYENGVTTNKENHLSIYSTGGFSVSVNSETDHLLGVEAEDKTIPSNTISVKASKGAILSPQSVQLSQKGATLFTSVVGGSDLVYNVDYEGAKLNNYFNKLFNQSKPSVFKTEVTYTIAPL